MAQRGGKGRGSDERGRGHSPRITAVEIFVYRLREDGRPEYLLLQRESGLWQPPCGKIETRETPIQAAKRETREETGFTPDLVRPAHWADAFVDPERGRLYLLPVFFTEVPFGEDAKTGGEHIAHDWLDFEKALERLPYHGYREALKAVEAARIERPMPTTRAERSAEPPKRKRRRGRRGRGRGGPGGASSGSGSDGGS